MDVTETTVPLLLALGGLATAWTLAWWLSDRLNKLWKSISDLRGYVASQEQLQAIAEKQADHELRLSLLERSANARRATSRGFPRVRNPRHRGIRQHGDDHDDE